MSPSTSLEMPEPESDDLGRYLEDTITIDWQTPVMMSTAKELLVDLEEPEDRVRRLFEFVRDEIDHSLDVETDTQTCRSLLRYVGFPTGFCYARLADGNRPGRFVLHGFNAVYWISTSSWIYLDARGNREGIDTECRFEAPWSLAYWPDLQAGERFLPFIYKRPGKRIIDLLERAPSLDAVCNNLPDSL